MQFMLKAYTSDVICEYAFGDSFQFLYAEDYGRSYFEAVDFFFSITHVMGHVPLYARLMRKTPVWITSRLSPILKELLDKQMVISSSVICRLPSLTAWHSGGWIEFVIFEHPRIQTKSATR